MVYKRDSFVGTEFMGFYPGAESASPEKARNALHEIFELISKADVKRIAMESGISYEGEPCVWTRTSTFQD